MTKELILKASLCALLPVSLLATGCGKSDKKSTEDSRKTSDTISGGPSSRLLVLDQFLGPCDLQKWSSEVSSAIVEDYLSKKNKKLVSVSAIEAGPIGSDRSAASGSCYWTFVRDDSTAVVPGGNVKPGASGSEVGDFLRQFLAPCEVIDEMDEAPKKETELYFGQGFDLVALVPVIGAANTAKNSCLFTFARSR